MFTCCICECSYDHEVTGDADERMCYACLENGGEIPEEDV